MNTRTVYLEPRPVSLIVTVEDIGKQPFEIRVTDETGQVYYYRELEGGTAHINLPLHPDKVKISVSRGSIASVLVGRLRFPNIPYLDEPEVSRPYPFDKVDFRPNRSMSSPMRMFTQFPVVEYNPDMMKDYWIPVREFIAWHEIAHRFFDDERKADTWATVTFLNRGWNLSTAIYALTRILGESPENVKRMLFQKELLKELSRRYYG